MSEAASIKAQLNHVGLISTGLQQGDYPGARAMTFHTKWGFNRWFEKHNSSEDIGKQMLLVNLQYTPWLFGIFTAVHVLVHRQLSSEDIADYDEVQKEVNTRINERKAKRALAKAEEQKLQLAATLELQRLANVGSDYEKRVAHIKTNLTGGERDRAMKHLNKGDPEVLFQSKTEAYQAGYITGAKHNDKDTAP